VRVICQDPGKSCRWKRRNRTYGYRTRPEKTATACAVKTSLHAKLSKLSYAATERQGGGKVAPLNGAGKLGKVLVAKGGVRMRQDEGRYIISWMMGSYTLAVPSPSTYCFLSADCCYNILLLSVSEQVVIERYIHNG
jgi:hypothetical protein